ncbi:MAG: peptidase M23 [Lysobacteraceae bacterium]|nr:MAG: peptidase M23 [Xanthomonadaceae bacterium]
MSASGRIAGLVVLLALGVAAAGALHAQSTGAAAPSAEEREARRKLDAVRTELKALAAEQRATSGERSEAEEALRAQDLALAAIARELHDLEQQLSEQQASHDALDAERAKLEAALREQRAALAALVRSAYALGRNEELRLLLQQDDVAAVARVLAYHRYFQRARVGRIATLDADLARLAEVQRAIADAVAAIAATRASRDAESQRLVGERAARETLVREIDARLADQRSRIATLGRDEAELTRLIERLRDVFADIPRQLADDRPFASGRGALPWPLRGKVLIAFGSKDDSGRSSSGMMLAAKPGTNVRAVSHGRVAFADWLRGYGLMIILDHGDGYLSLYGGNEGLLKDVGDWVRGGEAIATSGSSADQKAAGLYFELRANGKAIDPRSWLARN